MVFNSANIEAEGFEDIALVHCKNGKKSILSKAISIKQNSACKGITSGKELVIPTLPFSRTAKWHTINHEDMFTTSQPNVCPITKCWVEINGSKAPNEDYFKMVLRDGTTDKFDFLILQDDGT